MSQQYQRSAAGQTAERSIQQFAPLIHKYAHRFHKRAMGLTRAMDLEDIEQELSLVFERCKLSYDDSKGGSFMNFVITAWFFEMNRLFRKDQLNMEVGYTLQAQGVSENDEKEDYNLFDLVDSGWATPEETWEAHSSLENALESLSDQARVLVEVLVNPPDEVVRQFDIQERAGSTRKAMAGYYRAQRNLNMNFLFHLFRIPTEIAHKLQREIEQKVNLAFCI